MTEVPQSEPSSLDKASAALREADTTLKGSMEKLKEVEDALKRLSYIEGQLAVALKWIDSLTRSVTEVPGR